MKYFLLIAIGLFLLIAPWCVYKVGRRNELSISLHIARSHLTMWIFGVIGTIATFFAAITLYGVTLPDHNASAFTYVAFGVLLLEMLIATTVPHIEGTWRGNVHNIAAWGLCFSIPVITAISLFLKLSPFAFWCTVTILCVDVILLMMALGKPSLRKWFLQFQSSYLVLFFGLLAVLTFA